MKTTLAIIEDEATIRESLQIFIEAKSEMKVIGDFVSIEDFLSNTMHSDPQILILDIGLPGMSGISGIPHIKDRFPDINIVMLTTYEEDDKIFESLKAGACSYISKRTPLVKILEALQIVALGGSYMSPGIARRVATFFMQQPEKTKYTISSRQREIVQHIVEGNSYKEIADKCYISVNTVRSHIKKIYDLLQVNSKVGLISKYHKGEI